MPFLFTPNANMYIDQYNGIIGIGTNTPSANLHIIGSSLITGNLNVSGFTSISSVSFSSSITLTGLTVTGTGITGTLNTASQPSITSLGTLTGLSVAGTGITGTLNTATQGSITSVGTLTGLSVAGTGITGTLNTASQTNITSLGTLTGLSVTGTGITGILNNSAQPNITSVGTLTGLRVTGTGITGTLNNSAQPNITSLGTLTGLSVTGSTQLLSVAGTTGIYVSTLGNIGIGTSTPNVNLHVIGTSVTTGFTGLGNTSVAANLTIYCNSTNTSNESGSNAILINSSGSPTDYSRTCLYIGADATGNVAYIQSSRAGLNLPLLLNNRGGGVGIGTSTPNSSYSLDVNGSINTTSNYLKNGLSLAVGLFTPTNVTGIIAGTDMSWSSVFSTNLTLLVSSTVIQLPQQGIYKFEIMLNFTTGVSGIHDIILYYSTTSTGTYTMGLGVGNGFSAGVSGATTFFYSYLYSTTANSNSLFVKFVYPNFGPNSTSTFDTGGSTQWSRLQVQQIV